MLILPQLLCIFSSIFLQYFLWNLWFTFVEDLNFHLGNEGERSSSIKIDEHLSLNQSLSELTHSRFCLKIGVLPLLFHLFCTFLKIKCLHSSNNSDTMAVSQSRNIKKSLEGNLVGLNWSHLKVIFKNDICLFTKIFCCCLTWFFCLIII